MHELDLDVVADDLPHLGEHGVLLARHGADVDERLGAVGDHVVLVAGVELRRVRRGAQGGRDEPRRRAGREGELVGRDLAGIDAERVGDRGEELSRGVGEVHRPLGAAEAGDGLGELRDGVVADEPRTVRGDAVGDESHPDERLLPRLQQVGALAADRDRVAADLADRLGGAVEELRMPVDEPARTGAAARLLVGEERHDELALGQRPRPEDVAERGEHHRVHVLHVHGAATPQHPVADLAGERVDAPVARVGRHDVEVTVQHERGLVGVASGNAGDDARAARFGLEELGREAQCRELRLDVLGGLALPLRPALAVVGRVESDEVAGDHRRLVELGGRLLDCG